MATERELKFSTADDHVPSTLELELALAGSAWSASTGRVSRHIDVYYDADGRLGMAGVALRHRRSSGGQRVTLKADAPGENETTAATDDLAMTFTVETAPIWLLAGVALIALIVGALFYVFRTYGRR